jgi:hypothetical protein
VEGVGLSDTGGVQPGDEVAGGGVVIVASGGNVLAARVTDLLRQRGVVVVWLDPRSSSPMEVTTRVTAHGLVGQIRAADPQGEEIHQLRLDQAVGWYGLPVAVVGTRRAGFRDTPRSADLEAVWWGLAGWLNHPAAVAAAASRLVQVCRAAEVGMPMPAMLATTSAEEAQRFARSVGPVDVGPLTWPPRSVYGRVTDADLDGLNVSGVVLLEGASESTERVTVIVADQRMIVVPVESTRQADDRRGRDLDVPVANLSALLARLRLRVAVLDLTHDRDGSWHLQGIDPTPVDNLGLALAGEDLAAVIATALADSLDRMTGRGPAAPS